MISINIKDLASRVAAKTGLPENQTIETLETTFQEMADTLVSGVDIKIRRFATFGISVKSVMANPGSKDASGERKLIRFIACKFSKSIRGRVMNSKN